MKNIFKLILSAFILFGAVPTANAVNYEHAYLNEEMLMNDDDDIKKKKKKKGKKIGKKGKKQKKGFFSKIFGSK